MPNELAQVREPDWEDRALEMSKDIIDHYIDDGENGKKTEALCMAYVEDSIRSAMKGTRIYDKPYEYDYFTMQELEMPIWEHNYAISFEICALYYENDAGFREERNRIESISDPEKRDEERMDFIEDLVAQDEESNCNYYIYRGMYGDFVFSQRQDFMADIFDKVGFMWKFDELESGEEAGPYKEPPTDCYIFFNNCQNSLIREFCDEVLKGGYAELEYNILLLPETDIKSTMLSLGGN